MPTVVSRQEECNCPNRMAWCLFLPLDACPTLYRCMSTFSASTAQLFLCMAGITTMCSIKSLTCPTQTSTRRGNHPPKPLLLLQLQSGFRIMARELLFRTHCPLSRAACVPRGKVNPPTVEAKKMREEEGTVDFIFNSHKNSCLLELDTITLILLFFLSKKKFTSLTLQLFPEKALTWQLSTLWFQRHLPPSHLLFSLVTFVWWTHQPRDNLREGLLLPAGHPQSGIKKEERQWQRHTQSVCLPFLSSWKVEQIIGTSEKRSLLLVLTLSTQGSFFSIRNNARRVQDQVEIAFST